MTLDFTRNLSIIWLSLLCLVALAPPLIILYFAVRGMNWVHRKSTVLFQKARQGSDLVLDRTNQYGDRVAAPLIQVNRRSAQIRAFVTQLVPKRSSNLKEK